MSSLAAREPGLSDYAASKRQGELALSRAAGEMEWTALRPPAVYGPGDREILPLFRWLARGIAPLLGSRDARFSLLYIEDLAEAVVQWLDCPNHPGGPFELHDGTLGGYAWRELVDAAVCVFERRVISVPVPVALLKMVAGLNLGAARVFGYAPILTMGKVRELRHPNWVCDNAGWSHETGWAPRVRLEEGLRRTLGSCS
jgi:nucleoside-diphosphate-sugar epimerase